MVEKQRFQHKEPKLNNLKDVALTSKPEVLPISVNGIHGDSRPDFPYDKLESRLTHSERIFVLFLINARKNNPLSIVNLAKILSPDTQLKKAVSKINAVISASSPLQNHLAQEGWIILKTYNNPHAKDNNPKIELLTRMEAEQRKKEEENNSKAVSTQIKKPSESRQPDPAKPPIKPPPLPNRNLKVECREVKFLKVKAKKGRLPTRTLQKCVVETKMPYKTKLIL